MTDLTLAERLRVYAATSPDGMVSWTMDSDTAHELARLLDSADETLDTIRRHHAARRAERDAEIAVNRIVMWQVCIMAAALATWGIIA